MKHTTTEEIEAEASTPPPVPVAGTTVGLGVFGTMSVSASQGSMHATTDSNESTVELEISNGAESIDKPVVSFNLYSLWNDSYMTVYSIDGNFIENKIYNHQAMNTNGLHTSNIVDYKRLYGVDLTHLFDLSYDGNNTKYFNKYIDMIPKIKADKSIELKYMLSNSSCIIPDSDQKGQLSCGVAITGKEGHEEEHSNGTSYGFEGSKGFGIDIAEVFKIGVTFSGGTDWDHETSSSITHELSDSAEMKFSYPDSNEQEMFKIAGGNYHLKTFLGVVKWTDLTAVSYKLPVDYPNESLDANKNPDYNVTKQDIFTIIGVGLTDDSN